MLSIPPATTRSISRSGQCFGPHDQRLHARTADLVHRRRLNRLGKPGLDSGLTRRGLTEACGQHTAHINALNRSTINPSALYRGLDRGCAQIGCGDIGQGPLHCPHRSAGIGQDDDRIVRGKLGHGRCLSENAADSVTALMLHRDIGNCRKVVRLAKRSGFRENSGKVKREACR